MNRLTTLERDLSAPERVTFVCELTKDGRAERLRKRYDGARTAAAHRLGIDPITLFRYEKGRSVPVGERLRIYSDYLQELAAREAAEQAT